MDPTGLHEQCEPKRRGHLTDPQSGNHQPLEDLQQVYQLSQLQRVPECILVKDGRLCIKPDQRFNTSDDESEILPNHSRVECDRQQSELWLAPDQVVY